LHHRLILPGSRNAPAGIGEKSCGRVTGLKSPLPPGRRSAVAEEGRGMFFCGDSDSRDHAAGELAPKYDSFWQREFDCRRSGGILEIPAAVSNSLPLRGGPGTGQIRSPFASFETASNLIAQFQQLFPRLSFPAWSSGRALPIPSDKGKPVASSGRKAMGLS
jgi:hypothetical protein